MSQERKKRTRIVPSEQRRDEMDAEQNAANPKSESVALKKRVTEILAGKISTDDPVMLYLIEGVKDTLGERTVVAKNLQQAEQAVAQYQGRLVELKGVHARMMEDLMKRVDKEMGEAAKTGKKLEAVPEIKEPEHKEPDPEPVV